MNSVIGLVSLHGCGNCWIAVSWDVVAAVRSSLKHGECLELYNNLLSFVFDQFSNNSNLFKNIVIAPCFSIENSLSFEPEARADVNHFLIFVISCRWSCKLWLNCSITVSILLIYFFKHKILLAEFWLSFIYIFCLKKFLYDFHRDVLLNWFSNNLFSLHFHRLLYFFL